MTIFAVAIYNSHGANTNQRKQRSVVGSQLPRAPMTQGVLLPNGKKLEVSQLEQGLNVLSRWLPNDYQNIQMHKQEIIELIVKNEKPKFNSPINEIGHQGFVTNVAVASNDFTPCETACGTVAVDGIFFLFGLMGLRVKNNEMITRTLMREMGAETLNGFSAQIHNFEHAGNALEKAKALLPIMGGVYKAGGFSAALKAVKSQLSKWDYVKAGALMATQVVIWFGTDGGAFVAEVALSVMSAETLIHDSIKANTACPRAG
jgi:hypothetical protein